MRKVHFLGTGSGLINPQRNASAYLLEGEHSDILMDAGEPVAATLAQRDYKWSRLSGLVVSHTHADHTGGIPMLFQQLHLSGRTAPLDLYAPREYVEALRDLLAMHYMFVEAFKFDLIMHPLREQADFRLCDVSFAVHPTRHLEIAAARGAKLGYSGPGQAFAFRIQWSGRTLFYSGDVAHFDDVCQVMAPCDVAIIDSTHVRLRDVVRWASNHPDCQLYLSHVAPGFDGDDLASLLRQASVTWVNLAPEGGSFSL